MKKIFLLVVFLSLFLLAYTQVPQAFSYKLQIRGYNGNLHANKKISLKISVIQGSMDGNAVYSEKHQVKTSSSGIADIEIGHGMPILGLFTEIDWKNWPYFVKAELDLKCTGDYHVLAVTELLTVPYAMMAGNIANGFSGNYNDLQNKPDIPENLSDLTNDMGFVSHETDPIFINSPAKGITGTEIDRWNSLTHFDGNMQNRKISNLASPEYDNDAATKKYIDDLIDLLFLSSTIKLTDLDDNEYKITKIGNQLWMADYLKVTKFNNGDEIPYNPRVFNRNDMMANGFYYRRDIFFDARNVCPLGWHIPTATDWDSLFVFLGGTYRKNETPTAWDNREWYINTETVAYKITENIHDPRTGRTWCERSTNDFDLSLEPTGMISDRIIDQGRYAYFWVRDQRIEVLPGNPHPDRDQVFLLNIDCRGIRKDLNVNNYFTPIRCIRN